jgi:hypothetical protein
MPQDDSPHARVAHRKRRACLSCNSAFESEWAGERICPRCKTTATWRGGVSKAGQNHARYESRAQRKNAAGSARLGSAGGASEMRSDSTGGKL